jgi:hypothetical protein
LRQNVDRTRNFTYHDADESGNYNPELEARERANKRRAAKRAKKAKETETAKKEKAKDKGRKKTKARSRPNKPAVSTPFKEPDRTTRYLTAKDLEDIDDGDEDERMSLRVATPEFIKEDEAGRRGPVTEIQTSFAYPIDFSPTPTTRGCDFCESPIFGKYGYLKKSVHLIKWDTSLGYIEIGGGHCDKHNPTKMCDPALMTESITSFANHICINSTK